MPRAGIDRNYILAVFVNPMFDYGWKNNFLLKEEDKNRIERFANVKDVKEYVKRIEEMVEGKIELLDTLYK